MNYRPADGSGWLQTEFPTLESYLANPSSKISRLVEIIQHHIGPENNLAQPLFWNEAGDRIPPPSDVDLSPDIEEDHPGNPTPVELEKTTESTKSGSAKKRGAAVAEAKPLEDPQRRRKIVVYCHLKFGWSLIAHVGEYTSHHGCCC